MAPKKIFEKPFEYDYEGQVFRPVSLISRLRSEYGKEMPISAATCTMEPANSWNKSPGLIEISQPEFTKGQKEARFVIMVRRPFTLREFQELIVPRIPLQLRVTLYPTPSPVSGVSGVPMLPPQTDIAMLTIPEIPPGKIVFDHPIPDWNELAIDPLNPKNDRSYPVVTVKAKLEPSTIFDTKDPEFVTEWKMHRSGPSFQASGKNPVIEKTGADWKDDEWTYQKFRCNRIPEYGKSLIAEVKADATILGCPVKGKSTITFNPMNRYILNLSSNEVRLTGSEGSFHAKIIDVTPNEPFIVSTGQISVSVPSTAGEFLSVSPKETRTGKITCNIIRTAPTTISSVPLKISARVGELHLPDTPTVMVYLGEKKYRILCTPPGAVIIDPNKYQKDRKAKNKPSPLEVEFTAEIEVFDPIKGSFIPADKETIKGSYEMVAYQKIIKISEAKEKPYRYKARISVSSPISPQKEAETIGSFSVWPEKPLEGLEKVVIPIQVLKAEPPRVDLIVRKRGFAPVTINISERDPALAAALGSGGGVIKIPNIQGILELEGISLKEKIEYATGMLRIGEDEYPSAPDERSLRIVAKKEDALHTYEDTVLLTFDDQEIVSKLAGIRQDLKNYPSDATARDFTPELKAYSGKCLELFAKEKNTLLEDLDSKPGLASVYAGRIAKTWAFIRFAKDIYPLLERTENVTQQSFSRAKENLIDLFLQVAFAVAPWVYEKIGQSRGSTAPSLDELKPMAKEVVEKGLEKQFLSVIEKIEEVSDKVAKELAEDFKIVHACIDDIDDISKRNYEVFIDVYTGLKNQLNGLELPPGDAKKIGSIIDSFLREARPAHPFPPFIPTSDPYGHFQNQLKTWSDSFIQYQKKSYESFTSLLGALEELKRENIFDRGKIFSLYINERTKTSDSFRKIGELAKKIEAEYTTNVTLSELQLLLTDLTQNPSRYKASMIGEKIDLIQKNAQNSLKSFDDLKILRQYKDLVENHNAMLNSLKASLPVEDAEKLIALEIIEQQNWNDVKTKLIEMSNDHLIDIVPDVAKSPEMMELIRILKEVEARKEPHHFHFDEFGVEEYIPSDKLGDNSFKNLNEIKKYLQATKAGAEVSSSFLESIGKVMNTVSLNIMKSADKYLNTFSYTSCFTDESIAKVRELLLKWSCTDDYFGMGSKYRQISDLAEKLYKKPLEPVLSKEMMVHKREAIASECEKNDKRKEIISTLFHQAVMGSLKPDTLIKAPDVTSKDLGLLRSHLGTISANVLSYEQAFARAESLTQLPFYQRWYRYVTEDLGSAMEGGTSADVDQVIEWFAWVGSIVFMICSIILPIAKVVQAGTMAVMVAKKDIVDIFTSAIRYITSCFSTLDIVSGYYRDLLVLLGITYIGFYERDVEFESIMKKIAEPDPYSEWDTFVLGH